MCSFYYQCRDELTISNNVVTFDWWLSWVLVCTYYIIIRFLIIFYTIICRIPKALNFTEVQSRTMAIETAMKSSAFGFLLAKLHFTQYATRVPSAVSVVWMALVGAILAVVWRLFIILTSHFIS